MALTREQKEKIIKELKEDVKKQKIMIFLDFTGLRVKEMSVLRKDLKGAEGKLKVAKKTLIELVLKAAKIDIDVRKGFKGEVALVFGHKDAVATAKMVYQFCKANAALKILGGYFENKFYQSEQIIQLAMLPTREELLSRLVGSISSPMSNFVRVLQGNIKGLVYLLSAIKKTN